MSKQSNQRYRKERGINTQNSVTSEAVDSVDDSMQNSTTNSSGKKKKKPKKVYN